MGTTSLLISSTLSKKEKKLDHLEREFQKARLELDEKRCLVERKQPGATRQTIVTEVRERFDDRLAAYQSLSNEFHTLNEQVNAGIELLKAKDQEIAGEMNQWEQLAY